MFTVRLRNFDKSKLSNRFTLMCCTATRKNISVFAKVGNKRKISLALSDIFGWNKWATR